MEPNNCSTKFFTIRPIINWPHPYFLMGFSAVTFPHNYYVYIEILEIINKVIVVCLCVDEISLLYMCVSVLITNN